MESIYNICLKEYNSSEGNLLREKYRIPFYSFLEKLTKNKLYANSIDFSISTSASGGMDSFVVHTYIDMNYIKKD